MGDEGKLAIKTDVLGRVLIGEVMRVTGWSRWTLRRKILMGRFPPPAAGIGRGEQHRWALQDVLGWARAQPGYVHLRM